MARKPMFSLSRRRFAGLLPLSVLSGCAWILYPERRGQDNPGPVEVVPLVVDCLLFIPGIIPGVIALAVDFGTKAIYVPKGQVRRVRAGEVATLDDKTPQQLELRVLDARRRQVAATRARIDPKAKRQALAVGIGRDEPLHVELRVDGRLGATARVRGG